MYEDVEEFAGWASPFGLAQVKTEEPSEDFFDEFDKWFRQLSKDEKWQQTRFGPVIDDPNWAPEPEPEWVKLDGGMLAQVETESFWESVGDFVLGTMECEVC